MIAAILPGDGRVIVREVPPPSPGPGEALVDVSVAGLCGTDLHLARGYMGFSGIPGHEFAGIVRSVLSPADRILTGSRVVGEINIGCQECPQCARGLSRHCRTRRVLGILGQAGAFAEQLCLPVSNLRVVPESVPDEEAVFVEPLAAAFEILEQVRLESSHRVLVMGDGRLGLLAAQVLAGRSSRVEIAGRHDAKLAVARSLGLTVASLPAEPEPVYDLVVEATGSPGGLDGATRWCRPRGTVVMKSTCAGSTSFDAARTVVNELVLIGSRCGRFEPAIEALRAGSVQVRPLITDRMPLAKAAEAFDRAARKDALKILLRPGSATP